MLLLLLLLPTKASPASTTAFRQLSPFPVEGGPAVCKMKVVVDNALYRLWQRDIENITKKVMDLVQDANRIYRDNGPLLGNSSELTGQFWPIQFQIQELLVATDDFCDDMKREWRWADPDPRCRSLGDQHTEENSKNMLPTFRLAENFSRYCLAYLFTGIPLGKLLGRAMIGGACGSRARDNIGFVVVNENMNLSYDHLPLVLAHELTHSLGADHDPEEVRGYLMAPNISNTLTANAKVFSIGTIDAIRTQLMLQIEYDQCDSDHLYPSWCFANENESMASSDTANSTGEASGTMTETAAAIITAMIVLIVTVIIWKKWPAPTS